MFSKTHPIYLKLYKNKLIVCSPESGICIKKTGNFSNPRLVVADFRLLESLIRDAINELLPKRFFSFTAPCVEMVVQQFELTEGGISPVEERAIIDSCEHAYAKNVKLVKSDRELNYTDILNMIKNN